MLYKNTKNLIENIKPVLTISEQNVNIVNKEKLKQTIIDELAENITLNPDLTIKKACYWLIWQIGQNSGVYPASIHEFYLARARGEFEDLTVPAINVRGFTYETVRALLKTTLKKKVGAFILELARSEMKYTNQPPFEYAGVIIAAAIKEGFQGPLFIQLDHGQVGLKKYAQNPDEEIKNLKNLIQESIAAGFYNIDIDASTLVDLSQKTIAEQQKKNFEVTAHLTAFIRELEPAGITVSVGGEIGEIGGKNSTAEELKTFIDGYNETINDVENFPGLSKISVQSGATHGGVVLPDGSIAKVQIDFTVLKELGEIARKNGMGGVVQHGASTLPGELFNKFPENQTLEIHLATDFQNIIMDSPVLPEELREKMYAWIRENCAAEREEDWTDEQFIYKLRKKVWGAFKKEFFELPPSIKMEFSEALQDKFGFFMDKVNVGNTQELLTKFVNVQKINQPMPDELKTIL